MPRPLLLSTLLCLLAAPLALAASSITQWRSGRATYYGNEPWLWSIHEGSCGYGYLFKDEPLGWDVRCGGVGLCRSAT